MFGAQEHHGKRLRMALMPAGVAVTLLLAGCGSTSTPVASTASSGGPATGAAVSTPPSSAPVSPITQPSVSPSAPVSPAPASPAPASSRSDSSPGTSGTGPQSAPQTSGGQYSGAQTAGAQTAGAQGSAPQTSGAQNSAPTGSSLPVATVNTTDANAVQALSAMNSSLLTAAEVGAGFTKSPPVAPDTSRKLPCGGYSAAALYPNALRAELIAAKGNRVQFQESLNLYLDAATSTKAFDTSVAGLSCSQGAIAGTPVTIGRSHDVTASVGGSKATAWQVTIDGATGVLVAVSSGSIFIGYTFLAATGTDPATLPNPLALAKKATAKVLAAGLG